MGSSTALLVGVGASAGGLEALTALLAGLEASRTQSARIALVVVQHLAPDVDSALPDLLSRHTSLTVRPAADGADWREGGVFVASPGTEVTVVEDHLRVRPFRVPHARVIDALHHSVASTQATGAVVVLSGSGSDGSVGMAACLDAGKYTFVQDPTEAAFDGMPRSALAEVPMAPVLSASQIGETLGRLADGRPLTDALPAESDLQRVIRRLRELTDIDFAGYKEGTILRRLRKRTEELGVEDLAAYAERLEVDAEEGPALADILCVRVTRFFRDPEAWAWLEWEQLPRVVDSLPRGGQLRLWSAGCSTGQEAYSLAMLAAEAVSARRPDASFLVFATDVSHTAIQATSAGVYGEAELEGVSEARRERFFEPAGEGRMRVRDTLRRRVIVAQHAIERDPPFTGIHLLLCRNVLIYLRSELQRRFGERFHFALVPHGVLLLGEAEAVDAAQGFEPIATRDAHAFQRVEGPVRVGLLSNLRDRTRRSWPTPSLSRAQRSLEALVEHYAPPAVLVDEHGVVLHVSGATRGLLEVPAGNLTLEIQRLTRGQLPAVISAALQRAHRERETVVARSVPHPYDPTTQLRVVVRPLEGDERLHLVTFESERSSLPAPGPAPVAPGEEVSELQRELLYTRETLQSTIAELQTSNQDLQSVNEEMLATNEELQATNEELQATNEELYSVNAEREERIRELTQLNDDIDNMLRGADIGTLFLDEAGHIRKFTPPVQRFLPLRPTDVGRPLKELSRSLEGVDLDELMEECIAAGEAREASDGRSGDRTVLVRATPYEGTGRGGLVLNFVDVTRLKEAESRLQSILDSLSEHIAVLDEEGRIRMVNRAWERFMMGNEGSSAETGVGADYLGVTRRAAATDPFAAQAAQGIEEVLEGERDTFVLEYPCDGPTEMRRFLMYVVPLRGAPSARLRGAVVSHLDITARVRAEARTMRSEERYRRLFEASGDALLLVEWPEMRVAEANAAAERLLGRPREAIAGSPLRILVPESAWAEWRKALEEAVSGVPEPSHDLRFFAGKGQASAMVRGTLSLVHAGRDEGGQLVLVSLKVGQDAVEPLVGQQRLEALGSLAGGVAHELNNVLAAVLGLATSWHDDVDLPPELRRDLEDVVAACRRGSEVTRSLLGFSRTDPEPRVSVDLRDVVREVLSLMRRTSPVGVTWATLLPEEPALVEGSRSQLGQALMNLLLNAVDAVRGDGRVRIAVDMVDEAPDLDVPGPYVRLAVSDDGTGMDAGTAQRAFEPFFTTKGRDAGTGLGLSMVYGVAGGAGGTVTLDSELDVGTEVTVYLPESSRPTASQAPAGDEGPRLRTESLLLVVDDDPLARRGTRRMLERRGVQVLEATDAKQALDLVDRHLDELDGVLLDVVMPGVNGITVLERLRRRTDSLPVVLYSGYPDAGHDWASRLEGPTAFVTKPVDVDRLLRELDELSSSTVGEAVEGP